MFSVVLFLSFQHAHPSHQYTAPSRLLWRIRVITFVDLGKGKKGVRLVPVNAMDIYGGKKRGGGTYLSPYRRHHKVLCVVAVVYKPRTHVN